MDSITDLAPEIQKRISDFEHFSEKEGLKRPEVKFTGTILSSMLKVHHVQLATLGRGLGERISLKKICERLNRHLGKEGFGATLMKVNLHKNSMKIKELPYCVIDGSDIQKPEAKQMEGLGRVRDGSKKAQYKKPVIGNGYYWLNGVMVNDEEILPVYSDIYSLDREAKDHVSENTKIHDITNMVYEINPDTIFVIDRGGDSENVINPMLKTEKKFVIRGQSQRSLRLHKDSVKTTNIKEIAQRTKTPFTFKSPRNGEIFNVGIRKVYLGCKQLWLVVSRRQKASDALSWYLTNITGSRKMVMMTVMHAYGLRWRVEEYHRQIKQDYHLEQICLRKYNAIKNMGVILMLAAAFCARLPRNLVIKLLVLTNQLPRKRLSDIPDYPYYMIMAAVARTLELAVKRRPKPLKIRKRDYFQLKLAFYGV